MALGAFGLSSGLPFSSKPTNMKETPEALGRRAPAGLRAQPWVAPADAAAPPRLPWGGLRCQAGCRAHLEGFRYLEVLKPMNSQVQSLQVFVGDEFKVRVQASGFSGLGIGVARFMSRLCELATAGLYQPRNGGNNMEIMGKARNSRTALQNNEHVPLFPWRIGTAPRRQEPL